MDREILFRGKRLDNGEWLQGSLVSYAGGAKSILQSKCAVTVSQNVLCATQCIDVDSDTVGQYNERKIRETAVSEAWNRRVSECQRVDTPEKEIPT